MANLAIKGHKTRGSEVIAWLEMLGGNKAYNSYGKYYDRVYYINEKGNIDQDFICDIEQSKFIIYTLEEFEEKFPYKVGDKVTHNLGILMNVVRMYWDAECNVIRYDIQSPVDNNYKFKAMLAEHLQPYKEKTMEEKGTLEQIDLTSELLIADEVEVILGDYEFVLKDGKTYFVKKKPKYPKTYEECANILLERASVRNDIGYKCDLLVALQKLLVCRDAYWKIAGEQMGLGKPWESDWLNVEQDKYVLYTHNNAICSNRYVLGHNILAFPTAEMRDAFYENFKELIETCKELL